MVDSHHLLSLCALSAAILAAALLIGYLIKRPPLDRHTRLMLFFGLGPLPIAAALLGNYANLEESKQRRFCGSCHVMTPYIADAEDKESNSLAAIHTRTEWFGHESCYVCHADYGMFGTVSTKLGGLRHVWDFYTNDWSSGSRKPHLYKPYTNKTCTQCHPQGTKRMALAHQVHAKMLEKGAVSCAAQGCHGHPHPAAHLGEENTAKAETKETP